MSHSDNGRGSDGDGVENLTVPAMTISVNPQTMAVTFKATAMPIYFWQMCVAEVGKQLEEQRRANAALNLQAKLAEQARVNAIVGSLGNKG